MADVKPSDLALAKRIMNAYNLMLSARLNGEKSDEETYTRRVDNLLEQVPRPARF